METLRHFKKMSLWDFIDLMEANCLGKGNKDTYFIYLDELRMRRIESISEGGNFKLRSLAEKLLENFLNEVEQSPDFASKDDVDNFKFIVSEF